MTTVFETYEIPVLETENYQLRGMAIEDAPSLFAFMSDTDTMRYITPHPVQTLEEMKHTIQENLEGFKKQSQIPWVVINKSTGVIIGMFRFHKLHMWHKKAEMGVVICKEFQKRGVMTEILKVILPYGFHVIGLNRVVGDIFAENRGSQRLLEKYGFHKDGVLRQTDFDGTRYHDTVVYSMLKSEFKG